MSRSSKKGPFVEERLLQKIEAMNTSGSKQMLRTWSRTSTVFPQMVVQMISVGEETGALDDMLTRIADFYDDEVDTAVDSLTSLIEPIMIVVMGSIVGGMVIAMYLPMFKLINVVAGGK